METNVQTITTPRIARAEDIETCYRLILGREPDPEGFRQHVAAGLPLEVLVRSFINSPEYRTRTENLIRVNMYGCEFAVRSSSTMYGEGYEDYVFHHLMNFIEPGKRFLDIGANIGLFAIHAALRGAEVIAVEARPSNNALILENARLSGVKVELHPLAVSNCHGHAVLDLSSENENATIRRETAASVGDHVVALAILDELIGDRRIDVMKIDIEGHEYRALLGGAKMLARCRPVIVTEYDPAFLRAGSGVSGELYLGFLQQFGYRVSVILRSGELKPVTEAGEIDELCSRLGHHVDLLLEPC